MKDPEDLHDETLVETLLELDGDDFTDWEREFRMHLEDRYVVGYYELSDLQRDKAVQMIRRYA